MDKKEYSIIDVPANGKPNWYEGAYTLAFVYSKYHGNFILRGFRGEVEEYLKKNYTYYFMYISMWNNGRSRGHWKFWKENVGVIEPSKSYKCWKYQIKPYNDVDKKKIILKRLPKRWIPEFDKL